jgi:hypothetical protein
MATAKFDLKLLAGSDTAGYNSINGLITDIDNKLDTKVAIKGMIMVWDSSAGGTLTDSGWSNIGQDPDSPPLSLGSGLPVLSGSFTYIKKD